MYLGVVTYATAEYRPTPIITKRYFERFNQKQIREIVEEPQSLGLGDSGSGGKQGLSALEGYAAVLEVCSLRNYYWERSLREA